MIITSAQHYKYTLPSGRQGFLLRLCNDKNQYGWGEAAPWPGLHKETLDEVQVELENLLPIPSNLFPTVSLAVDMAILDMLPRQQPTYTGPIFVNGLLYCNDPDVVRRTLWLKQNDYKTVKIKVGRGDIDTEAKILHQIYDVLGNKVTIRLDANCSWALDEAVYFAKQIRNISIEYIEEPLQYFSLLEEFYGLTSMKYAYDEHVTTASFNAIGLRALVIKPSVVGSIKETISLMQAAKKHALWPILSSPFDSSITIGWIIYLQQLYGIPKIPIGLGGS